MVAGRPAVLERLTPDKLAPAPDYLPERYEQGTLPYELMAGTTAAVADALLEAEEPILQKAVGFDA